MDRRARCARAAPRCGLTTPSRYLFSNAILYRSADNLRKLKQRYLKRFRGPVVVQSEVADGNLNVEPKTGAVHLKRRTTLGKKKMYRRSLVSSPVISPIHRKVRACNERKSGDGPRLHKQRARPLRRPLERPAALFAFY
ncbi:hypothetical protein EVAR_53881_1 [Eumeta japonica]|uniref:Uncharacterized protein n=1 Tax=Eumeta variegata TaxID=151549 RepID=A0A4C1XFY9_EUMVA|nr:hypothetical protein EVAR_53881_1 [Eumeta japonica]